MTFIVKLLALALTNLVPDLATLVTNLAYFDSQNKSQSEIYFEKSRTNNQKKNK